MRDRLLAALREVAVLDARCTSVRERLLIERSDEIVGELDRYAYRMASVLVDYRFDARQLRAWYDAYAALMGRLGLVDGRSPTLQAEEIRRLEREAGLPLDQMSVTWSALQEAAHAGRQARNELVETHQWLVATLARKYSWSGLEQADLVAEGNLGLMRAIDKYDYARGFRVSTYAAWWIRSRIERAIVNTGSNIRLPVHLADRIRKYRKAAQGPVSTAVHDPASADIAAATGLPPEELGSLLQLQ
jgi:RNA polymerase sigma factor (sigma-70 family)